MAKSNQVSYFMIYGRCVQCRIIREHSLMGTVDVERLSDGRCFRVSGLAERL